MSASSRAHLESGRRCSQRRQARRAADARAPVGTPAPAFFALRPVGGRPAVRLRRRGFTLVELMVVVVLIGLLAALALPAFQRVKRAALGRSYFNDARQIRDGAERYALEHGDFPPNGIGALHAELRGYVPDKLFGATPPIGGVWDWDYGENGFTASIAVYGFTASPEDLRAIDQAFDDGDLATGSLRRISDKFILVIQP